MKLHSPEFEQAVLRGVKRECRANRELAREMRRQSRAPAVWPRYMVAKFMTTGVLLGLVAMAGQVPGSHVLPTAVVTLAAAYWMITLSQSFVSNLFGSYELVVLSQLPMEQRTIFAWFWQRHWLTCAGLAFDFVIAYAFIAFEKGNSWPGYAAAAVLGVLQCGLVLCLSLWAPLRIPVAAFAHAKTVSGWLCFALFIGRDLLPFNWVEALKTLAWPVNLAVPFGWLSVQLEAGRGGLFLALPLLLLPAGWLLLTGRRALAIWRDLPGVPELDYHQTLESSPELLTALHRAGMATGESPRAGPTAVEDAIHERRFLGGEPWEQGGFIERRVARWWTPRERTLADFMFDRVPAWSQSWQRGAWMLAGGFVAAAVLRLLRVKWYAGAYVLGGAGGILWLLPFSSGFDRGFQPWVIGAQVLSFHAGFPIGYREMGRAIGKAAIVRSLAAAPVLFVFSCAVAVMEDAPFKNFWLAHAAGLKLAFMILLARPFLTTFRFSSTTNDSSQRKLSTSILSLFAAGGVVVLGTCEVLVLAAQTLRWTLLALGLLGLVSYGFYRLYGWHYNRGRFDFLKPPPKQEWYV